MGWWLHHLLTVLCVPCRRGVQAVAYHALFTGAQAPHAVLAWWRELCSSPTSMRYGVLHRAALQLMICSTSFGNTMQSLFPLQRLNLQLLSWLWPMPHSVRTASDNLGVYTLPKTPVTCSAKQPECRPHWPHACGICSESNTLNPIGWHLQMHPCTSLPLAAASTRYGSHLATSCRHSRCTAAQLVAGSC